MVLTNGHDTSPSDLIDLWLDYTEGTTSPPIFRLWAGITMIAGALERRVWAAYGDYITYPNVFTLLVAHPGVGKNAIEDVRDLWQSTHQPDSKLLAFHVASDSVTKASLVDELSAARQTRILPEGPPLIYHSLLVSSEEFSVLLPSYNPEFIGTLNALFMNRGIFTERRRTSLVKEVNIEKPTLNILAGTQPSYLSMSFPDEVWNSGIARRLLMIYADEPPLIDIFAPGTKTQAKRQTLLAGLSRLSSLHGQIYWEPTVANRLRQWHLDGGHPRPSHSRLVHYVRSRTLMLVKLILVSIASTGAGLVARESDLDRALDWLLLAERSMPDIFRAMVGKSDFELVSELHRFVTAMWSKNGRKGSVQGPLLRAFLLDRAPSEKIELLIASAERANVIARVAGTQDSWVPRALPGQTE